MSKAKTNLSQPSKLPQGLTIKVHKKEPKQSKVQSAHKPSSQVSDKTAQQLQSQASEYMQHQQELLKEELEHLSQESQVFIEKNKTHLLEKTAQDQSRSWLEIKTAWKSYYPKHKHQVWYMFAGFIVSCSLIYQGLLRTLIFVILMGIGYIGGQLADGNLHLVEKLNRFIKRL